MAVIGLKAVFDSHILKKCKDDPSKLCPIPDLYSLHSWMGLISVILFSSQWVIGLITFLFPGQPLNIRSTYLPFHVFFGLVIFVCSCATALLGLTEKAIFSQNYSKFEPLGMMANCIGLFIILFCVLVMYLISNPG